jgi:DNA polymerase-3 subunit gamma/tau
MAYEVIARKWRPQTFGEVVGQEAITRTLRNAVEQERLHHAYLFTGARGVGKTTTARILAKALNCAKGVTPEPCGVCASCTEIAAGGSLDVIEIDAASHTGVDNIRDVVINSVGIAPARDRYKVFIVDEVHQLSAAAFNALLKTLEEPPSRVVFVLATTELHKVPDTIVSRCQLFEFRTISVAKIQAKLADIVAASGVEATPAALAAVARAGEGSMRDAQSALDQVIAFAGDRIDVPDVAMALGIVGDETLYDAFDAISRADGPAALRLASRLAESGHDLRHFTRALMRAARNLLVVRAIGYDTELVDATEAEAPRVAEIATRFTEAELVRAFSLLAQLEQDIRHSADPRFQLEIGLVRLAELPRLRPLDEILDRLSKLEASLAAGGAGAGSSPTPTTPPRGPAAPPDRGAPPASTRRTRAPEPSSSEPPPPFFDEAPPEFDEPPFAPLARSAAPPPQPAKKAAPPPPPAPSAPAVGLDGAEAVAAIRARLEATKKMLLLAALEHAAEISLVGPHLTVRFDQTNAKNRTTVERARVVIESAAREITGHTVHLAVAVGGVAAAGPAPVATPAPAPAPKLAAPSAGADAASDPIVRAMLDTFQGQLLGFDPPSDDA